MTASPLSYGPFISRSQAKEQGLKHYFTGKPCRHGHVDLHSTSEAKCSTCKKNRQQQNYLRNREARLERMAENRKRRGTAHDSAVQKAWREANKKHVLSRDRNHYQANKERILAYHGSTDTKQKRNSRRRELWANDAQYKFANVLRGRVATAFRRQSTRKGTKAVALLGCSVAHAMRHIESQFVPGMTWDNWAHDCWHVDHIRPCASFDLTDPAQQLECFHYTNLQPLWAEDNLRKSDTWEPVAA